MDRDRARELLMGYIDGELTPEQQAEIEALLRTDPVLRREERDYRRLKEMTDGIEFVEPTETEWRAHWSSIYNRLERGTGWVLLSIGMLALLLTGAWHFLADFLLNAKHSFLLRFGVGTAVAGVIFLVVSVVRERMRIYRVDRYNEVEL